MADMTSHLSETNDTPLPTTRQELMELVTKLVTDSHGKNRNTEDEMAPETAAEQRKSSTRSSAKDMSCVKDLLANHSQQVYQFRADDHNAQINGQSSFATLVFKWETAHIPKPWDSIDFRRFPRVRSGRGAAVYNACTVQCTCADCNEGDPVKLVCESYPFGRAKGLWPQILVHRLYNDPENRAIILGGGSEPETYLIWGTHPTLRSAMAYNRNIVLRQVHHQEPEQSLPSPTREPAKKRQAPESIDSHSDSEAHKQPRTNHHQQHPLARSPSHQPLAGAQQPGQLDFQQAYRVVRNHVIAQKDRDMGLSIIFSNDKLFDCMKSLEAAAKRNDGYLFRLMREVIDEELAGTGFPRLPTF